MLTQQKLKELFIYCRYTGVFTRKITTSNRSKQYAIVGTTPNAIGYCRIGIENKRYYSHRLAFLYEHGYMPKEIDHINHNRSDNSIDNLREVSRLDNSKNTSFRRGVNTYATGVYKYSKNRWRAYITVDKNRINIGTYDNPEEALMARKEADKKYGFHKNHGNI